MKVYLTFESRCIRFIRFFVFGVGRQDLVYYFFQIFGKKIFSEFSCV